MPSFLIAESETDEERATRRAHSGKSSGESYAATLRQMVPGCAVDHVFPADEGTEPITAERIARHDAVFLSGSPMHVYRDCPPVRRQLAFMLAVFQSGTPSFGSCAGLQVAVAAAGGTVRGMAPRMEAGVARRITATHDGRDHPLLAGRAPCWDAPAVHGDEVAELPGGAVLLATNAATRVQAVEIRQGRGVFWGVQYHPELAPGEIAAALRRQSDDLVDHGLAMNTSDVTAQADLFDALHREPADRVARWRLGVDDEFAVEDRRRLELRNFLDHAHRLKRH